MISKTWYIGSQIHFRLRTTKAKLTECKSTFQQNEQRTRHNTKNLTKTECRPKQNHNTAVAIKKKEDKLKRDQLEMNDQPRIETCSCSNVNTLFASFSARSHTKPHTKNQQQQLNNTFYNRGGERATTTKNIVRLRFHKSREPAVLSSTSGVFSLFHSFQFYCVCPLVLVAHRTDCCCCRCCYILFVCLLLLLKLLLLLSFVSSRHFFPLVLFWTRFYRRGA